MAKTKAAEEQVEEMSKASSASTYKYLTREDTRIIASVEFERLPWKRVEELSSRDNTTSVPLSIDTTTARSFKIEDVIRMGKQTFFEKVSPESPLPMPHFEFTDEENERMDQILADQRD